MHSTPIRLAKKHDTPKSAADCALSDPANPNVRAATDVDNKTTNVDVAAATCGWTFSRSNSGEMIIPPEMPRRPAARLPAPAVPSSLSIHGPNWSNWPMTIMRDRNTAYVCLSQ